MSELWLLTGKTPCAWRIPYWVKWPDRQGVEADMWCAIPLLKRHERIAAEHIEPYGRPVNGMWCINLPDLQTIATEIDAARSDQDYLESLFCWPRERNEGEIKDAQAPGSEDFNELVDLAHSMGLGECREQVVYWFAQLYRVMWEQLYNRERPVDLGFVKLHNSPYRSNWKQVLMSRNPSVGRVLTRYTGNVEDLYNSAMRTAFLDELICLDLLAMREGNDFCYRTIEVEYKPKWWKMVSNAETQRLNQLGDNAYADYFMRSVRAALKKNLAIYTSYCAQVAVDSAAHVKGDAAGSYRLIPHRPLVEIHTKSKGNWPLPTVLDNKFRSFKPASDTEHLFAAYEILPSMPLVQPASQDVRNVERINSRRRRGKK